MGLVVRILLAVGGFGAAQLVSRESPNFVVVQAMVAVLVIAVVLLAIVAIRRR